MKYCTVLLLIFTFSYALPCFSQVEVIRSEKTEIINSIKYYIHEVKKGESLYAICKAYGVDQSDVAIANPEVFDGIKPGQLLKIPFVQGQESIEVKIHKTEKGETLYALSKKYKVTVDDLIKWNPELKDGLKNGQEIKIHVATENKTTTNNTVISRPDSANPARPAYHIVKEKETLYGISKQYNMSITEIEQNNPDLVLNGLRTGDTLALISAKKPVNSGTNSSNPALLFPLQTNTECTPQPLNRPVRVALILPFSEDAEIIEKEDIKLEKDPDLVPQTKPFIEYYEGFLAALDTIKAKGMSAEIYTYDSQRDSSFVAGLISSGKLNNMDIIIGPVYQNEYKLVSDFCKNNGIWSVYPMNTNNPLLDSNPYIIQVNPSFETQVNQAVLYMASFSDKNYIIAHYDSPEEKSFISFYKTRLFSTYNINFPGKQVPYCEVSLKDQGLSGIEKVLKDSCDNVIILTTSSQATILDLLNKLNGLSKNHRIVLTFMPQWKKFEKNIEFDHLFNMQAVTFDPFYVDYTNDTIDEFNHNFNNHYRTFPDKFSYLGYDTGIFLISLMSKYGKDFGSCITNHKAHLLQSEFYFVRNTPESGYENRSIYIIKCISTKAENSEDVKKEYKLTGRVTDKVIK